MTSDGIADGDWDRVHALALEIVNAGETQESEERRANLLAYLDELERTYGPLPSILATRADYLRDSQERLRLLLRAYQLAVGRNDAKNTLYVAASLASLHIEDERDAAEGARWLTTLAEALREAGDESDIQEYQDLERALQALRASP